MLITVQAGGQPVYKTLCVCVSELPEILICVQSGFPAVLLGAHSVAPEYPLLVPDEGT